MILSRNAKILVGVFAAMSVCGILFTPLGLETRPLSSLRSQALIPFFLSTTILDFASLILIFKTRRIAAILGSIAAVSYIYLAPADQAHLFFLGQAVPPGVTANEYVVLALSIVVLILARSVYEEGKVKPPSK
jgi:hypothetical protein